MCRVCGQAEETILHLLSACPQLAATAYLYLHNLVASVIHWHLSKVFSLPLSSSSWFTHHPQPVIENSLVKILWDFNLVSESHHLSNRPDIVVFNYVKKTILFIEVSCPADINVPSKEREKLNKYQPLAHDFHSMYKMPVPYCNWSFRCNVSSVSAVFEPITKLFYCYFEPPSESRNPWNNSHLTHT